MLKIIQDVLTRIRANGENGAIKIETPDLVHTTHEIVDMILLCCKKRACPFYGEPDRITEYIWTRQSGDNSGLPIEKSLETD